MVGRIEAAVTAVVADIAERGDALAAVVNKIDPPLRDGMQFPAIECSFGAQPETRFGVVSPGTMLPFIGGAGGGTNGWVADAGRMP